MLSAIGPEGIGIVTLNGSGNGTASVGPLTAREIWHPQNCHVSVASNASEATCNIYAGDAVRQQTFRDATFTGSSGDSTDKINADTISAGIKIFAVWTNGDPGAQAVIRVTGTKDI